MSLSNVLGVMMATGMAGRSGRGAALAAAAPMLLGGRQQVAGAPKKGMSFGKKAGLAALAYLAYKTYQDSQQPATQTTQPPPEPEKKGASGPFAPLFNALGVFQPKEDKPAAAAGSGGLGDRLSAGLRGGGAQPLAPELDDAKALLLIRAMIAAANADGQISKDERRRILDQLAQAGAGADERRTVERELDSPPSMDQLVGEVRDPDTAEEVYLASLLALQSGSPTEQSYLDYLASRLSIPPERRRELDPAA